jgi:hypothetical protein
MATKGRLKRIACNVSVAQAGGIVEVSTAPSAQITSAQPVGVLGRFPLTDAGMSQILEVDYPMDILGLLYIHQTGAASVALVNLVVQS